MKKSLISVGCALIAVLALGTGPVFAGGVKGKVSPSKEFKEYFDSKGSIGEEKIDYYWQVENGVLPVSPPTLDLENQVALALFTKDGSPVSGFVPSHPEVFGAQLVPGIVVAPPKATIKFHNADPFVHELFSDDLGKLFEPELQNSQKTRQIQFTNEGTYLISCKTTPHLQAWVVIIPGVVAVLNPAANGSFLFEEVPAGEYVLRVFFEGKEVSSKDVTVVDSEKEKDYAVAELEMAPPPDEKKAGDAGSEKKAGKDGAAEKKKGGSGDGEEKSSEKGKQD